MISSQHFSYLTLSIILLSGCAAQTVVAPTISPTVPVNNDPTPLETKGLESILGLTAAQLERSFGKARLDVSEANGRKLQFSGDSCIMDAYLYVPDGKKTAVVTHIDARRSNGAAVDRAACVEALRRQ